MAAQAPAGRGLLIVLDSVGCGGAPDAADFGDSGADTLGGLARALGGLRLPHLDGLGLGAACAASTGVLPRGLSLSPRPEAIYGCATEISPGKDTPIGHWEIAGAPFLRPLGAFARKIPALPAQFTAELIAQAELPGILGDRHMNGFEAIAAYGEEHIASGKPILYTSVDSVIQIAAHERIFGLERLYETCGIARALADHWSIGRVIARPFVGGDARDFQRTPNRRDFSMPAPRGNLLDRALEGGRAIYTIGKTADIFGHRATGREIKTRDNQAGVQAIRACLEEAPDGALIFANLVDFDSEYGHRRDALGYARALERFDAELPGIEARLRPGDLMIATADHGNDPTFPGTDHTRENIPIMGLRLAAGRGARLGGEIGRRKTFADIGQSFARHLRLQPTTAGERFENVLSCPVSGAGGN